MGVEGLNLIMGGGFWLAHSLSNGIFPQEINSQDDRVLTSEKRKNIESIIQELRPKLGIEKEVLLKEQNINAGAKALGNNLLQGPAIVVINPHLFKRLSKTQAEFLIAHELSHIQSSDLITTSMVGMTAGLVTTFALSKLSPALGQFSTTLLSLPAAVGLEVSLVAYVIFSRWREECADKKALSVCSEEGKKEATYFFERYIDKNLKERNEKDLPPLIDLWRKLLIDEKGNSRHDLLHPRLTDRVDYLTTLPPKI